MTNAASKISPEQLGRLLIEAAGDRGDVFRFSVEHLEHGHARLRLAFDPRFLRPGGTVSGPVMFTAADTGLFAAVLTTVGVQPLAVTTDMNIHFLRRPIPGDLLIHARVIKPGRRLVVGDVLLFTEGEDEAIAHATGTYAVPRGSAR